MKKKHLSKFNRANERQKLAWESLIYSDRRIDLLLISISGGGIYVCLETIRFLSENNSQPHWLIWVSSISFLSTIVLNFIGQFIGKKSNFYDFLMCEYEKEYCEDPDNKDNLCNVRKYDELSAKYDKKVNPINYTCTALMIIGITSILSYFLLVF